MQMPWQRELRKHMMKFQFYNSNENSLSGTINLAFYFAREYYTIVRELPTGKGFADVCMIPRKRYVDKPAIVIELKWDKSAVGALDQIKEKQYGNELKDYQGNLLLVGINYKMSHGRKRYVLYKMWKKAGRRGGMHLHTGSKEYEGTGEGSHTAI